jgi:glycerol uptake facilitator-like aquaporin
MRDGWHWKEWSAELIGTALLLFAVVMTADAATGGPLDRDAIIGSVAGTAVIVIAFSPLGRRSGGHLNPAVTVGLWLQRVIGRADLVGYCVAQVAGAVLGVEAARVCGAHVGDPNVRWSVIAPANSLSRPVAAAIEAAGTFVQLGLIYALLTTRRYHAWAPVAAGLMLATSIVALATVSGAGFSPVRALGPDIVTGTYPAVWIYLVGPLVGAAAAAGAVIACGRRPLTGKLHHDPRIPCHMRCEISHLPAALPATGQWRVPASR